MDKPTYPYSISISNEGVRALDRWDTAKKVMKSLEEQRVAAAAELSNATEALGNFMTPKDAKAGEIFNMVVESRFLQVTVAPAPPTYGIPNSNYAICWR